MGKLRSAIFTAAGIAAIVYGTCEYQSRFSDSGIWERQSETIRRKFQTDGMRRPRDAKRLRDARFDTLREGIRGLGGSSQEERCRFETRFDRGVVFDGPAEADAAISRASFEPYSACRPESQLKSPTTLACGIGGILSLLIGAIGFALSFRGKESAIGRGIDKARKKAQAERRDELLRHGFHSADAYSVAAESIRIQSVNEALSGDCPAKAVLATLSSYGFGESEIRSLLIACPAILNRSSLELAARLSNMESNGAKSPDEVRSEIMRLPGLLG